MYVCISAISGIYDSFMSIRRSHFIIQIRHFSLAAFQTSPSDIAKFIFIIIYFNCMIIEIFVPCYFGSVVVEKSRKLTHDMFLSNWIERGPLFKKSLGILVERTFRPIATFAGGVFLLHLPTFLSVNISRSLIKDKSSSYKSEYVILRRNFDIGFNDNI